MEGDFRIGDWLTSPQLSRIRLGEEKAEVELKAMEVLVCLASHADEVVLRERFIQEIWPNTFVKDAVLAHAISGLHRPFLCTSDFPWKEGRFRSSMDDASFLWRAVQWSIGD